MTNGSKSRQESNVVHIRASIEGEPARILLELKRRGLARSNVDAISQSLITLWEKIIARELREAQLKTSQRLEEGE